MPLSTLPRGTVSIPCYFPKRVHTEDREVLTITETNAVVLFALLAQAELWIAGASFSHLPLVYS